MPGRPENVRRFVGVLGVGGCSGVEDGNDSPSPDQRVSKYLRQHAVVSRAVFELVAALVASLVKHQVNSLLLCSNLQNVASTCKNASFG